MESPMTGWVWPKKCRYTPELMADGQYRFEETDEPVPSIAADFDILTTSFWRLAQREGWKRRKRSPRDVPNAARILKEVEAMEQGAVHAPGEGDPDSRPPPPSATESSAAAPPITDSAAIDRLHLAVLDELAAVEALRTERQRQTRRRADIDGTARTLGRLTDTLHKLQQMRCRITGSGSDDDDIPADIDEFRRDLARRIEAFVRGELDAQNAGGDPGPTPVAEAR